MTRDELQAEMQTLRDDLQRRQRELESDHAFLMEQTEEALARAQAAAPLLYRTTTNATSDAETDGGDIFTDEQLDVLAEVPARKSDDFHDALEAALRPIRDQLADLREQVQALMDHRIESLRLSAPIERPRLLK
jgi:LPS O-antigen subunit length determinant protein (WzzB/FepE family)